MNFGVALPILFDRQFLHWQPRKLLQNVIEDRVQESTDRDGLCLNGARQIVRTAGNSILSESIANARFSPLPTPKGWDFRGLARPQQKTQKDCLTKA